MKILIVDDHPDNLDLLTILLQSGGYEVFAANNGKEALDRLRDTKVDLIISDILMPVMDGFTFCRECMKDDNLKDICFVFYTATYTDKKDEDFALSLGVRKFIRKPQEPEIFLEIISKLARESCSGRLKPVSPPQVDETEVLKLYSERLIAKLEKKNLDLEHEIAARQKTEEELTVYKGHLEELVSERTSRMEAANQELEAFAYSVSHDLRAPLRALNGLSGILAADYAAVLDDNGKKTLLAIQDNVRKMGKLIDDLLAFSRLVTAGLQVTQVDMQRMANDVFHELTTPEMRQRIDFQVNGLTPASVDFNMIRQVWVNLLSNAVKFSSKCDKAVISVTQKNDQNRVVYCITDNGAGFNQKYADKLFGVFQRLHSTSEFEGTGAGLAIVKRIILRHGGQVWADGEEGRGATFCFALPV